MSAVCYNPVPKGEQQLANLSGIVKQLKKERDRVEQQLSGLDAALRAFANVYSGTKPGADQRARWAKVKRGKKAA